MTDAVWFRSDAFPPYAFPSLQWLPFIQISRTLRLSGGGSAKNKATVRFSRLFGDWICVLWKLNDLQKLRPVHAFSCLSIVAVGFYA
jgi:hypothetical protein